MIASLPMYDRPETAPALGALWQGIRRRLGGDAPEGLTRTGDLFGHWTHPSLLLSQTCGMPYRTLLHGKVQLLGAPDCRVPGCPPGHYNSVFVVRSDDPRDMLPAFAEARLAYNEGRSQSGWAAPQTHAGKLGFAFTRTQATGAHGASALAVAKGRADIAAIDALTWRLIARHDAFASTLRVLARTEPTPALPFITALGRDAPAIRAALAEAIEELDAGAREALSLYGLIDIPDAAYRAVPTPAPPLDAEQGPPGPLPGSDVTRVSGSAAP